MTTPILYQPNTFSDDITPEGSQDEGPDYSTQDEGPTEQQGPDPLRREYPDYTSQDEGGNDGGGSSSDGGGGSGGGSAAATPAPTTPDPDKKKKWKHERWKREHAKGSQASQRVSTGTPVSAVDKSIARNGRKSAGGPPKNSDRVPPVGTAPLPVMPSVQVARQMATQTVQARPLTASTRLVGVSPAPVKAAPSIQRPAARKFGFEDLAWELGAAWAESEEEAQTVFGVLTIDDQDAIQKYMADTMAVTPEATKIKDEYTVWYDGLYWFQKTSQANYDKARNYRNQFNLANATTAEEKQNVQDVITGGLSTEQTQGEPDRRTSTGMYAEQPTSLLPWEIAGVAIAGLTLIVGVYAAASHSRS